MCILYLERFFLGGGGFGGVEVFPGAESRTTDHAETGWDIMSPAAAD